MNNHQYQSWNFDNTNNRSPKCGEGPKRCRRCRSYNEADDQRPRSAGLMAESNPAESSGRIGSEGDWLKRSGESWGSLATFVATFLSLLLPISSICYVSILCSQRRNQGCRYRCPFAPWSECRKACSKVRVCLAAGYSRLANLR